MIDMHIHVVPPNLPGVGSLNPLLEGPAGLLAASLRREMQAAGVTQALAMGGRSDSAEDPLGIQTTLEIARSVPGLAAIGIADPAHTEPEHFRRLDTLLASRPVRALKAYLGYLHYGPDHPGYRPYYELADRHDLPFIFHTGDTYSPRAKVRFAHPLLVDEVAVDHPRVRFVLAHLGNPWLLDAAEVVYKNANVWADLSGLAVGEAASFTAEERQDLLHDVAARVREAYRYAERPDRFLFGSDWPLASLTDYAAFIRSLVPEEDHTKVMEENARRLFRL
ncbi:MAG: amidohydrolase [Planctomycetes bacterium]|nr:amidohydrolase [Planctomycetota bacterium]